MAQQAWLRRGINGLGLALSAFAMLFGLIGLLWILYTLVSHGISHLTPSLFTQITPAPNSRGGVANAIVGSVAMTALGVIIGGPVGILTGIYLSELGNRGLLPGAVRFVNDILLSAPSIVIGLFIYEIYVIYTQHFSGWAGALALSLLVVPVVVRTTENMLRLVPNNIREAAYALGAPQWKVVFRVSLRAAKTGVLTGVLLAVARIAGETAPLLFTALNNQFFSTLNQPMANLPVVIFQFAMSPFENWHALAWAGSLLIALFVLLLNVIVRFLMRSHRLH